MLKRLMSALVLPLLLAGCDQEPPDLAVAASGSGLPMLHRTPADAPVPSARGRDCSVIYLVKGERYCRSREPATETLVFCTRSLGVPDCWADPSKLPNHPREIADGPRALTPEQEANRTKWRPWLW